MISFSHANSIDETISKHMNEIWQSKPQGPAKSRDFLDEIINTESEKFNKPTEFYEDNRRVSSMLTSFYDDFKSLIEENFQKFQYAPEQPNRNELFWKFFNH